MIPITVVEFGSEEEDLVLEVLRSGRIAQGPLVARFEELFAELTGVSARDRGEQRHHLAGRIAAGARPRAW